MNSLTRSKLLRSLKRYGDTPEGERHRYIDISGVFEQMKRSQSKVSVCYISSIPNKKTNYSKRKKNVFFFFLNTHLLTVYTLMMRKEAFFYENEKVLWISIQYCSYTVGKS